MAVRGRLKTWLDGAGIANDAERSAVIWSFSYFFCLLASYFILRPLRDEMGVAAGRDMLQYLFTATFVVMLVAAPLYAFAWSRLPRRLFIPLVYHFFVLNLLAFWLLLYIGVERAQVARVFFVWVSVFNLFAVSVFWSFLADIFRTDQGKRLYGFIAAGGTAGTWLGSSITVGLTHFIGVLNLLLVAGLLLEIAVFCARRLEASATGFRPAEAGTAAGSEQDAGKDGDRGILAGFRLVLSSPYLCGIAAWVALLSLAGTFLYFVQRDVVAAASPDPVVRTQIFAGIDLAANVLTLLIQAFFTGKLIERMGTGSAAAVLPLAFAIGFAALAVSPVLAVIVGFQVLQRTANFAISNPAREIFFTAVEREEKYKAKSVIDTAIFRGGDVLFAWVFTGLRGAGLTVSAIALASVPVALAWAGIAVWLGREQEKRVVQASPKSGTVSNGG